MRSDTVLDGRLFVRLDLDHSWKTNSRFESDRSNRGHLANQLLLYERLVIPTSDLGIVPILISWFGLRTFSEALESGTFSFLKKYTSLGYAGNGLALSEFQVKPSDGKSLDWWKEAKYAPASTAVELQLANVCPFISARERNTLCQEVVKNTRVFEYGGDDFVRNVARESYRDISSSDYLLDFLFTIEKLPPGTIDLERLPSVTPNQLTVPDNEAITTGVHLVLRVAEINMEIAMAIASGNIDLCTSTGADELLAAKLKRSHALPTASENFIHLLDIGDVPDVGAAVVASGLSLQEVWRLRNKKVAQQFRKWFRSVDGYDQLSLTREYVRALSESPLYNRVPMKVLRLAVTEAADFVLKGLGSAIGVADSFFVEKWLAGFSPKLMLDKLRRLPTKNNHKGRSTSVGASQ